MKAVVLLLLLFDVDVVQYLNTFERMESMALVVLVPVRFHSIRQGCDIEKSSPDQVVRCLILNMPWKRSLYLW